VLFVTLADAVLGNKYGTRKGGKSMRFTGLPVASASVLLVAALCAADHGERWWGHIGHLGADALEERLPGTPSHLKAAQYVAAELEKAGVLAAGRNGYLQPVKIRSRRILEQYSSLELVRAGVARPLAFGEDAIVSMGVDPAPAADAPLVFVGYGLTIPELHYDDLAGLDLHGKIAVILSGGPAEIPGPFRAHAQSTDERHKLLRQRAGVFGIVTIQNPRTMEVPWSREAGNRLEAATSAADPAFEQDDQLELSVMFNPERADKLFEGSGHTFKELLATADAGKPLPRFPLAVALRARVAVERNEGESQNVIGVLPGNDPELKREYVVLSAHLDHRAMGRILPGGDTDAGAMDDASGAASLLDIAGALHESPHQSGPKLRRSLLFVFLTGEEKGLLGAEYFGQYPGVDAGSIVANLKVDLVLPLLPLGRITVYGLNESDLGARIRAAGARKGVRIQDDPVPQWDLSQRTDQYSLIRRGVPAVSFNVGYGKGSTQEQMARTRLKERYQAPVPGVIQAGVNQAGVNQAADKSGASRFDSVVLDTAMAVANQTQRPQWLATSYFKRFSR
jgi:Peptidase family M28